MRLASVIILFVGASTAIAENITALCLSPDAQLSCGTCIQQNPLCAWCRDPHMDGSHNRCQPKTSFLNDKTCNPDYVYSPETEMKIAHHNLRIGSLRPDGRSTVQLEPQQVVLRMKPGDELTVPFKYVHNPEVDQDVIVQTSQYHAEKGVQLQFFMNCNGQEIEGKQCSGAVRGQQYDFKIKVTLQNCSNDGDVSISVGVYGYNTVSAIYITPLCGCECEKLQQREKNSPLCHGFGNLICGQCICDSHHGGQHCECPLATFGVKTSFDLEQQCRKTSSSQICEGQGSCKCGRCECKSPTIQGKFCDCDSSTCPNNCSNNGECSCGKCKCEEGWERDDCSCTTDRKLCMENGVECSGNGRCECGKCVCNLGFTGAFCGSADEMTPIVHDTESESEEKPEDSDNSDADEDTEGSTESQTSGCSLKSFFVILFFIIPLML
ncbi:unnamed protein product [Auanema sp. JU1783]|nr:unnamed protein product [Auanema sp. JU1783]